MKLTVTIEAMGGSLGPVTIKPLSRGTGIFFPREDIGFWPVAVHEEAFTDSPDSEGDLLIRTKVKNPTVTAPVIVSGSSTEELREYASTLELLSSDVRSYGGRILFLPDFGSAVEYHAVSMKLTDTPFDRISIQGNVLRTAIEMSVRPYGILPEETIITAATSTEPMLEFDVPELPGSIDALGVLTLTDLSGQAREHMEGGFESKYYDPNSPWPIFIDSDLMDPIEGASEDTTLSATAYGGSHIRQTLSTTMKGVASVTSSHVGRFRVKARVQASTADTLVRLGYSVRGGGISYRPWVEVPIEDGWFEADLQLASFEPPISGSQSTTFYLYAKSTTGTPTLDVDYFKVFPAERYWKAAGSVGSVATVPANGVVQVRFDSVLTETTSGVWALHPNATGTYLKIPVSGGRVAVALNRNNLDEEAHTPLGDEMQADLTVIPRVALMGQ